ncbi:MAG: phosphoribosyl-ATP diphosphatase [Pirellulales bacterium]
MTDSSSIFARLMAVIEDRKARPAEKSYTTTLLAGGVAKIGDKIREEAAEIVAAAGEPGPAGRDHTIGEAADCFYHLLVLLAHRDISLADVEAELERRFGTSGLAEKASRRPGDIPPQPMQDRPS